MRNSNKAARGCLAALVFLFIAGIAAMGIFKYMSSPAGGGGTVTFTVRPGQGVSGIADDLKAKGLIRSPMFFTWCAMKSGSMSSLKAGEYKLSPSMTPQELIAALSKAPIPDMVRVMLLEGWTSGQFGKAIEEAGLCPKDRFMAIVRDPASIGLNMPEGISNLEGFLFPDTYDFKPGTECGDIVKRLVSHFSEKFTADHVAKARALGLNIIQAVTLASLVEKEARIEEERRTISGVMYRRLKAGHRLEIDATYKYRDGEWLPDARRGGPGYMQSYDTYAVAGLPPGPICNPGAAALDAAVEPDVNTKYWYYVTRKDGSYGHYFNETFAGHQRDIGRSAANRRRLGN